MSLVDPYSQKADSVTKVPLGDNASKRILREYDVLSSLAKEKPGIAPRPLFVDQEHGLAVQETIVGKQLERKFTHEHIAYLSRLKVSKDVTTIRAEAEGLARRFEKLKNTDQGLGRYVENLVDGLKDVTELPASQVHGDFRPWNILRSETRGIVAIDWEFSESRQILGLDVIHYYLDKNYSEPVNAQCLSSFGDEKFRTYEMKLKFTGKRVQLFVNKKKISGKNVETGNTMRFLILFAFKVFSPV